MLLALSTRLPADMWRPGWCKAQFDIVQLLHDGHASKVHEVRAEHTVA